MVEYYRIVVDGIGIYEAIEKQVPRGDTRRFEKPDESWLLKVGMKYPGTVSFWTRFGIHKYIDTGLLDWQMSVVTGEIFVIIADKPKKVLYTDDYQIICDPISVTPRKKIPIRDFLKNFNSH